MNKTITILINEQGQLDGVFVGGEITIEHQAMIYDHLYKAAQKALMQRMAEEMAKKMVQEQNAPEPIENDDVPME